MMKYTIYLLAIISVLIGCRQKQNSSNLPPLEDEGIAAFYDSAKRPFYHGVASGDPLQDRVIIWTRVTPQDSLPEIEVNWEISEDDKFEIIINSGKFITNPARDYTVKVDVDQLSSGKIYFYRFKALDKTSPIGRTKTAPQEAIDELKFAVASCSNYEFGPFHSYLAIAEEENLDAVLHLGDYIYEYGPGSYGDSSSRRFHYPPKEISTLEEYRLRYSQYRLDSALANAHQKHPFITIWDDHEIANNSYKDGAQNHQEEEGNYEFRKRWAKQAYYEWLPVRESEELYRSFDFGGLADLLMLDERLAGRTAPPDSLQDPDIINARMLGEEQLQWFEEKLKSSEATWKVIGSQVIFSYLNWGHETFNINLDSWDGYPAERDSIEGWIKNDSIENVIFVTGDTHSSWAFEVTDEPTSDYQPFAIEFGTTSINSGNSDEKYHADSVKLHEKRIVCSALNPHLKFANLRDHGYMILQLTPYQASAIWKYVNREGEYKGVENTVKVSVESGKKELKF